MKTNLENLNTKELQNTDGGWCATPGSTPAGPWAAILAALKKGG